MEEDDRITVAVLLKEELHVARNDIRHHPTVPVTPQRRIGVHYAGRRAARRMSIATEPNFDTLKFMVELTDHEREVRLLDSELPPVHTWSTRCPLTDWKT